MDLLLRSTRQREGKNGLNVQQGMFSVDAGKVLRIAMV